MNQRFLHSPCCAPLTIRSAISLASILCLLVTLKQYLLCLLQCVIEVKHIMFLPAMAGAFEDSYGFSFQADSVHSGSISFGRFENEPLSWERRSSFSHNRYLEEVEKYSRPGSVNEKKAYFEAHFRKKLLLRQSLSDEQTGTEHQNDGHESSETTDYREEIQLADMDSHFLHFDETPVSSEYGGGESEVRSHFAEASQGAEVTNVVDVTMEIVPAEVPAETAINTEQGTGGGEKEEVSSAQLVGLSQHNDASETITRTERSHPPPKVADSVILKPRKVSPKSQPSVAPMRKHVPHETAEDSQKTLSRSRGTTTLKTNKERPSRRASSTATSSVRGISSSDNGHSQRAKVMPKNKSEPKGKKFTESLPLASNKIGTRAASTGGSRPRPREESKKPEANPKTGIFSFKSDERAESRKEFLKKMEEKMQAKEAEINQIHARAQQKTGAEIKQFRKSLNFNANPMPSFYHTEGNKSSTKTKATQPLKEPLGPMRQSAPRSRPESKTGSRSVTSASDVTRRTDSVDLTSDSISTTGATNGQKGVRKVARSRRMSNEMPKKGMRSGGMSRSGHVAVIGVAS